MTALVLFVPLCVYLFNFVSFWITLRDISPEQVFLDQKIQERPELKELSTWILQKHFDKVPKDTRLGKIRSAQADVWLGDVKIGYETWKQTLLMPLEKNKEGVWKEALPDVPEEKEQQYCCVAVLHLAAAFAQKGEREKAEEVFDHLMAHSQPGNFCGNIVYSQWLLIWEEGLEDPKEKEALLEKAVSLTKAVAENDPQEKVADYLQYVICLEAAGYTHEAITIATEKLAIKNDTETTEVAKLQKVLQRLQTQVATKH